MKTKKASKTNQKSRIIFFATLFTYNLLLGLYLKDFFKLSPMLVTLYLLSALPTLFFVLKIRSTPMRAIVFVVLIFIVIMSIFGFAYCSRLLSFMTMITTIAELMYLGIVDDSSGKDTLLTKIYVLAVSVFIIAALILSYNFVCKPESPYLLNGGATLWDTQTEELADEICAGCDTDAEKVQAIYSWIIHNFEYDYNYHAIIQYFNVRQTLHTRKGVCYDFSNLFAALCRSQNIPCYVVDGTPYDRSLANHTWNRVYYNNTWWDVDVTNDMSATKDGRTLYGFQKLENSRSPDNLYWITKQY